jgi:lipoprotein-anchoring transpeptidase ErfK/SrfK
MAKSSRSNMGLGIAGARASASAKGNRGSIMQNYSRPLAGVLSVVVVAAALAVQPAAAREVVAFKEGSAGSIIIKTNERRLYYVLGNGHAVRYPVGVGKAGKRWSGSTFISGKYRRPDWSPPKEVKRDKPRLPDLIKGGSPRNPMGEAALTLSGGEYAIHGTNMPGSVGGFVSYGCIRMYNQDILDLFARVSVGTSVTVE